MAPSLLGISEREISGVSLFEIRLDQNPIILRGSPRESSSTLLKGSVVLCLSRTLRVHSLRLQLTGKQRLDWAQVPGPGGIYIKHKEEFFRRVWDFVDPGSRTAERLPPGNYEWQFEHVVPGNSPVSVEGLEDNWVIYRMKATIERGMLQPNKVTRKHVRFIRTLDASALELSHEMCVQNTWPEKVEYSLSTPTKGVIFGTAVRLDFKVIPLVKGLKILSIVVKILESLNLSFGPPQERRQHSQLRETVMEKWDFPDDAETQEIDGRDGYVFHRTMELPKNLRECRQTVESKGINIRHRLEFNLRLHSPGAPLAEVQATLPLHLYISPNLPIDDNNNLVCQGLQPQASEELNQLSPPIYTEHQFDRFYSGIDTSGYTTPAGGVSSIGPSGYTSPAGGVSGIATPFLSRSHAASAENLVSMDAVTARDFAPNILQSRLRGLENAGSSRWARDRPYRPGSAEDGSASNAQESAGEQDSPPALQTSSITGGFFRNLGRSSNRPSPSNPASRRGSAEDLAPSGTHTPRHIEFSVEDLSKVPSYTTALHTRATGPINDGLPNYETVASIPNPSSSLPPSTSQVHVRTPSEDPSSPTIQHENVEDMQRRRMMMTVLNLQ